MDSDVIYNDSIKKYVYDIRNMNILTNCMLHDISKLSRDDMMGLIYTYNNSLKVYKEFIERLLEN
jgi:hypothetical protein